VHCHAHARADARAPVPFWEGVTLALSRTYDLSRVPVVVVGGDGANWIDTALEGFPPPQAVRQRDGFHLARDAGRGWGPELGATLYQAVRTGNQATATALLALPAPPRTAALLPPPPNPNTPPAAAPRATTGAATGVRRRSGPWSAAQVQRARTTFTGQVGTPDAAVDWRLQVPPHLVPPGARGLGTQEGTNAHLLAKRMKHKGMAWRTAGARAMAKARELVTNGRLPPWCHRPAPAPAPAPTPWPRHPGGRTAPGPLPWPQVSCPAARGPFSDPIAATLHRIDTGGRTRHRLT
jgi:hypothetical protein